MPTGRSTCSQGNLYEAENRTSEQVALIIIVGDPTPAVSANGQSFRLIVRGVKKERGSRAVFQRSFHLRLALPLVDVAQRLTLIARLTLTSTRKLAQFRLTLPIEAPPICISIISSRMCGFPEFASNVANELDVAGFF